MLMISRHSCREQNFGWTSREQLPFRRCLFSLNRFSCYCARRWGVFLVHHQSKVLIFTSLAARLRLIFFLIVIPIDELLWLPLHGSLTPQRVSAVTSIAFSFIFPSCSRVWTFEGIFVPSFYLMNQMLRRFHSRIIQHQNGPISPIETEHT
jgi:hypothetical protein